MRRFALIGLLFVPLLAASQARAQSEGSLLATGAADSVAASGIEETLLALQLLKLDLWLLRHSEDPPDFIEDVQVLRDDAAEMLRRGDLATARAFVETCWELIEAMDAEDENGSESIRTLGDNGSVVEERDPDGFRWSREVLIGTDFWRQDFDLAFITDTSFVEDSANPFVGLRLNFEGGDWKEGWLAHLLFKTSRDYLSGEAGFEVRRSLGGVGTWSIGNRLEGTRYRPETLDLKYLQNSTRFLTEFRPLGRFQMRLEDDLRIRRYGDESDVYPSYLENTPRALGYLTLGPLRLGVGGRLQSRSHASLPKYDYREWGWEVSSFWSAGLGSALFFELRRSRRDYFNTNPADTTFLQPYNESTLNTDWRLGANSAIGFRATAFGTIRKYESRSPFTLDYLDLEARPELVFRLSRHVNLALGFFVGWRDYREPEPVRLDLISRPALRTSIDFEDYRTLGPSLTLEILGTERFMLNLVESYQWRRYPNSQFQSVDNFSLYSNRNINSLLLFLSWAVSADWQLDLIANLDDDRGQQAHQGNSQSTLFSLQLTYGF